MSLSSEIALRFLTAQAEISAHLSTRSLAIARQWTMSVVGSALAHTAGPALLLVILSATSAELLSPPSGENSIEIMAVMASDPAEPEAESLPLEVQFPLVKPPKEPISKQARLATEPSFPIRPELPEPLADSLPIVPPAMGLVTLEELPVEEPPAMANAPQRRQVASTSSVASVAIATVPVTGVKQESLPSPVKQPQPEYPADLLARRVEGVVSLRLRIAADGSVAQCQVHVSSGHDQFDQAAITAVQKWTFLPAKRLGVAVEVEMLKRIRFEITQPEVSLPVTAN